MSAGVALEVNVQWISQIPGKQSEQDGVQLPVTQLWTEGFGHLPGNHDYEERGQNCEYPGYKRARNR